MGWPPRTSTFGLCTHPPRQHPPKVRGRFPPQRFSSRRYCSLASPSPRAPRPSGSAVLFRLGRMEGERSSRLGRGGPRYGVADLLPITPACSPTWAAPPMPTSRPRSSAIRSQLISNRLCTQREVLIGLIRALPEPERPPPVRALQIARRLPKAAREQRPHLTALCEVAQMLAEGGRSAPIGAWPPRPPHGALGRQGPARPREGRGDPAADADRPRRGRRDLSRVCLVIWSMSCG